MIFCTTGNTYSDYLTGIYNNHDVFLKAFIKCVLNILELNELLNPMFLPNTDGILRLCNPP